MLSDKELSFIEYWKDRRLPYSSLQSKIARGLPMATLFCVPVIILLIVVYLFFPDAVFGTTVEVPTIDGRAKIKIPPGTQGGKIFRLKGKGFPQVQGYEKGDQLIHVSIWTPQQVTQEEKSMLEKMQGSKNFEPHPEKTEKSFFDKVREMFS